MDFFGRRNVSSTVWDEMCLGEVLLHWELLETWESISNAILIKLETPKYHCDKKKKKKKVFNVFCAVLL